ncbi:hypothetical protein Tco_1272852 [Tanacetum coccineum]
MVLLGSEPKPEVEAALEFAILFLTHLVFEETELGKPGLVPTGRVIATVSIKVPTGRYIVPAGYIVPTVNRNLWNIVLLWKQQKTGTGRDPRRANIMILPPVTMEEQIDWVQDDRGQKLDYSTSNLEGMRVKENEEVKAQAGSLQTLRYLNPRFDKDMIGFRSVVSHLINEARPDNEDCNMKFLRVYHLLATAIISAASTQFQVVNADSKCTLLSVSITILLPLLNASGNRMYMEEGGFKDKDMGLMCYSCSLIALTRVSNDGISCYCDATDAETQFALMGLSPHGYGDTFGSDEVFDLSAPSIFDSCLKDAIEKPLYDWFVKPVGMHAVPPPITGTFMLFQHADMMIHSLPMVQSPIIILNLTLYLMTLSLVKLVTSPQTQRQLALHPVHQVSTPQAP